MATDLDGVAQCRFGVRCGRMDSRRRTTLSGVMVASMAEWPDKGRSLNICSEDGPVEDGGDDTCECVRPVYAPDPVCGSAGASGF